MSTQLVLIVHSGIIASLLLFWLLQLLRRALFRWTTAGFWVWSSFLLYYVLNPIGSVLSNDFLRYDIALSIAGGVERALLIGVAACVGISAFFLAYLRTQGRPVTWNLDAAAPITTPMWYIILLSIGVAVPSLLIYRAGLIGDASKVVIEQGRFTGDVSGYQYSAHALLLVPAAFLILSASKPGRLIGWLSLTGYVAFSALDPWGRYLVVSTLVAISVIDVVRRRKNWPRVLLVLMVVFAATLLRVRGHTTFESRTDLAKLAAQVPENVVANLGSGDAAMMATWYLESYTKDTLGGYDYGLPILTYSITGLLPYKFFPWKYDLLDQLRDRQYARIPLEMQDLLYGGKSTLLGSFYAEGGLLAVMVLAALVGFLLRKMDGMLNANAPPLVLATGIMWLSLMWMVWGSADYWAITNLAILALPAISLWLVSPRFSRKRPAEPANRPEQRQFRAVPGLATRPFVRLRGDQPR